MKDQLRATACALALVPLSACGGGGGGPRPEPTPLPPPPPPPPPPTYSSFGALDSDQQVPPTGVQVTNTETYTSGVFWSDPEATSVPYSSGRLSISYNAATRSYTVRDGTRSSEFRPSDVNTTDQSNGEAFVNHVHHRTSGTSDRLALYRPTGGGGDVPLTYTTLALWAQRVTDFTGGVERVHNNAVWAVGGFETVASDMPRAGTATYVGPLRGFAIDSGSRAVGGQSRLTADFAAQSVLAELSITGISFPSLLLSGTGTVGTNRFGGSLSGGGYSGLYDGAFFGPRAAEMGLSFIATDPAGRRIVGVGAGRQ